MPRSEFTGVEKILVIKLRHIGDVLLTVPAIRALKESFPGARVSALVNSGTEEMLTANPLLDEVITFDRSVKDLGLVEKALRQTRFVRGLRSRGFDMTVDLTGGDRPALLGFFSGAGYRLACRMDDGFAGKKHLYTHLADPPVRTAHTVLKDLGVVRAFGIDTSDLTVDIHTSSEDDAFVDETLGECGVGGAFVHAHPVSRWLFKCWPDEFTANVLDWLQKSGVRVVMTAAPVPGELERVKNVLSLMETTPVDLSGRLKLKHLAALSKRAGFFFGVDSAPMHIAAAVGTPTVGIFGPSGAFNWGPWDNRAANAALREGGPLNPYPEENGIQSFGANTAVQLDWDCVPCGRDGCEGTKKSRCLDELTPEAVWKVLAERYLPLTTNTETQRQSR